MLGLGGNNISLGLRKRYARRNLENVGEKKKKNQQQSTFASFFEPLNYKMAAQPQ